ncbi:hypothetical protein N9363_10525, partial [Paracoccaceae bacterium]|nr:hypothetical protein [Paracoccaceae bacterium]
LHHVYAAMQFKSLKRPFRFLDRCRSQTDLLLITVATDDTQTLLPFIDLDQTAFSLGKVISNCGAFTF